jgi:hypothetical protein
MTRARIPLSRQADHVNVRLALFAHRGAIVLAQPVDKKFEVCLTGPVNHGVLFKVICFAQNPSAAMRGGFLRCGVAINNDTRHSPMRNCASENDERWIGPVRRTMPDSSGACG